MSSQRAVMIFEEETLIQGILTSDVVTTADLVGSERGKDDLSRESVNQTLLLETGCSSRVGRTIGGKLYPNAWLFWTSVC